jgi:hypothetical protein
MGHPIAIVTVLLSGSVSAFTGYLASRISQSQQQSHTEDVYRLAIVTEIRTLHGRLARYEDLLRSQVLTGKVSGARLFNVLMPEEATAVFADNASSIGVFDTRAALRILRFYADVRTLQGHAQAILEMGPAAGEADFQRHQRMLGHARRQAHRLIKGLRRRRRTSAFVSRLAKWRRRWAGAARREPPPTGAPSTPSP